jgi:hypothetical protein
MLSAVITALLLSLIVLIAANFAVGVLRERKRHLRLVAQRSSTSLLSHPLDSHVTMVLHMHEGMVMGVEKPEPVPTFTLSSSWYNRHRTLVSVSFLLMLFFGLFLQSGLADGTLRNLSQSFSFFSAYQSTDLQTVAHPVTLTASARLVRVDSASRNQYYTDYQLQVWSYASCSGISLEEVMNAYGRHLIAADVLQVEQNLGVWDTYNGLTGGEPAMARTANYFGFKASPNPPRTLQDLINVTNKGFPVIVGMPGHILVVRGGDSRYVYLADSAPANRKVMTRQDFLSIWNGFSVLITPK